MRIRVLGVLVVAGCLGGDDDSSPGPEPVACPAEAEACGVRDGGFELHCADGAVEVADLTTTLYCRPGTADQLCESELAPRAPVLTCAASCADTYRYFDTYDEYSAFDPQTMCQ